MTDILKALIEATGSEGGFLVPDEFAARVLELIQAKSVVLPDLEQVNMSHETMYIPKTTSGTTAYFVGETGTITASDVEFGRITLTAKKCAALVEASTEVLEDANVSVANIIVDQMSKDMALKLDNEVLNGTGGTFNGLRDVGTFVNAVDSNGNTNTGIITSNSETASTITGGTITLTAISKAIDEVLKDNHDQPNVSYWNPRTVGSLRVLTDGNARPILNSETWGSPLLREGVVGTVYGTKVKPTGQMPTDVITRTSSAIHTDALVGVSKMFGIWGNRRGVRMKRDYKIATDVEQYQATIRSAFSVKYPEAYCVIRGLTD